MRYGKMVPGAVLIALSLMGPIISALDPIEWEGEIEPRTIEGFPMVTYNDCESIDIEVDSDIPVDIFIVDSQEDFQQLIALSEGNVDEFTNYEKKYEDVTHKKITQDYDHDKLYYMIVFNPSETESASVTVEYEFWEDAGEEIVEGVCCSGTMGILMAAALLIAAVVVIAIKRKG